MSGSIYKCKPVYRDGKILLGYVPAYPGYYPERKPLSYSCKGTILPVPPYAPCYMPFDVDEVVNTQDYTLWSLVKKWYDNPGYYSGWDYFINKLSGHTSPGSEITGVNQPCYRGNHGFWQTYQPCGGRAVPDYSPTHLYWDAIAFAKYGGQYWWTNNYVSEEPPYTIPNPPSEANGWHQYNPASADNYASISPFGGVNNTPQKYRLSVTRQYSSTDEYGLYERMYAHYQFVLTGGYLVGTDSSGWYAATGQPYTAYHFLRPRNPQNYTVVHDCSMQLIIHSHGSTIIEYEWTQYGQSKTTLLYPNLRPSNWFPYEPYPGCNDGCCLKGTRSDRRTVDGYEASIQVSWRPEDCDYTVWNATTVYQVDACVSYVGKFFKACDVNGPGTTRGVVAPQDTDPDVCTGSNVWRVV